MQTRGCCCCCRKDISKVLDAADDKLGEHVSSSRKQWLYPGFQSHNHALYSFNPIQVLCRHRFSITGPAPNCFSCLENKYITISSNHFTKKKTPNSLSILNVQVKWLFVRAGHSYESVTVQRHVCNTPECTFQRQDSSWACWTFACYQELRVKWRELIFCLLEVHSLGLRRSLAHSLGCHAEGSLSHPSPPPITTTLSSPFIHSLFLSLFHSVSLPLCVAAASPPADTCPAVTGRDVRWAADTRIDLPPFPHKLHIKLLETLKETKSGRRDGDVRERGERERERGGRILSTHIASSN